MNGYKTLYDEIHAIMAKEFLTFFKGCFNDFESEVPYNYFGNRGSVDVVQYNTIEMLKNWHIQSLNIYELETQVLRLEELVRKLKDRMEYFPRYFEESRGLPKLEVVGLNLVLLSTKENLRTVNNYAENFKSAFSRICHIFPKDIMSNTKDPSDDSFSSQIKRARLIFFDPLKVRQIEINESYVDKVGMNRDITFDRLEAFRLVESWSDPVNKIRTCLKSIKPEYANTLDFHKKYKQYIRS